MQPGAYNKCTGVLRQKENVQNTEKRKLEPHAVGLKVVLKCKNIKEEGRIASQPEDK